MLVDTVTLVVDGGNGGAGALSFRQERFIPWGGPDGGDGGRGGEVFLEGDERLMSLALLERERRYGAGNGGTGQGGNRRGKDGGDLVLRVPLGTEVWVAREGGKFFLGEILASGSQLLVARGGRGGWGNAHFRSPSDQTPRRATNGQPGEERHLWLEFKLMLDVAIIGPPNSGKSSLLARLTSARPRVADYPFTTTQPEIGVARVGFAALTVGELPGLVAEAHAGRGLGSRFLRHAERARLLLILLDGTGSPTVDLSVLTRELELYSPGLAAKLRLVAVNKVDLPGVKAGREQAAGEMAAGEPLFFVSAATGEGVAELLRALAERLLPAPANRGGG